jgi:23S rRNA pseudouridine1911/1915/1917 synthase
VNLPPEPLDELTDETATLLSVAVPPAARGERLDRFLAAAELGLSRAALQRLISDGRVLLDGRRPRPAEPLKGGEAVTLELPPAAPTELVAEDLPLTVVYQDDDLVVVDKPAGLVVHPAPGHPRGTLVNALLFHFPAMSVGGSLRPGIVHRLDQHTSGLLVVARHDQALAALQAQQAARTMTKRYLALTVGRPREDAGVIDAPIGRDPRDRLRMAVVADGRPARTHYRLLEAFNNESLLELTLETGRTHQIRVHLRRINCPVVGDPLYGPRSSNRFGLKRQFLHAAELGFLHPRDGRPLHFSSPLPADLQAALERCRRQG